MFSFSDSGELYYPIIILLMFLRIFQAWIRAAAGLKTVLIFFFCSHPAADMALRLVDVQYDPCLRCKGWIDVEKAVCDVLMYRRF